MAQMCVGQPCTPTDVVWKGGLVRNLPDRDQQRRCANLRDEWHFRVGGCDVAIPVTSVISSNQTDSALQACIDGLGPGMFFSYQVTAVTDRHIGARRSRISAAPMRCRSTAGAARWACRSPRLCRKTRSSRSSPRRYQARNSRAWSSRLRWSPRCGPCSDASARSACACSATTTRRGSGPDSWPTRAGILTGSMSRDVGASRPSGTSSVAPDRGERRLGAAASAVERAEGVMTAGSESLPVALQTASRPIMRDRGTRQN